MVEKLDPAACIENDRALSFLVWTLLTHLFLRISVHKPRLIEEPLNVFPVQKIIEFHRAADYGQGTVNVELRDICRDYLHS